MSLSQIQQNIQPQAYRDNYNYKGPAIHNRSKWNKASS